MILTGSYHGGKASSFEKDDVFIKELELFVTDSLWCYLRLHGLMEESSQQDQDEASHWISFLWLFIGVSVRKDNILRATHGQTR